MADWPADGVTDWNTKMKANIDVGHDSDGTHKKSQMLTDMGYSPTTMTGANDSNGTATFPNGLIWKWGKKTLSATTNTDNTVTFGTAFPNACFQAFACSGKSNEGTWNYQMATHTITAASFKIRANLGARHTPARWFAVGR